MSDNNDFSPKSFAVVGAGPVGCIVAAFLARGGYDVTLCDVIPELIEPALDPGIIIEGEVSLKQVVPRTCTSVDALADHIPDVIFLTVKANASPLIASAIEGFYREGIYVVSWQNGIDTELEIAKTLGRKPVMRAVVNYGCGLIKPGRVHMAFQHPPHYIQELDPESRHAAIAVAELLSRCGLTTSHTDQITSKVWRKTIMNATTNSICAVTGMTMAQAISDPIIYQVIDLLFKEGVKVARANEIYLGSDYYPFGMGYQQKAGHHKPSMLIDIEMKRRTEVDFMNGKLIEYGRQAGIETPYNFTLMALVKALESK
ncbi:ketopantoate reductase family protein [Thermodesulfobacteriota bacterium]